MIFRNVGLRQLVGLHVPRIAHSFALVMKRLIAEVVMCVGLCGALCAQASEEIVLLAKDAKIDGPTAKYDPAAKAIRYWGSTNVIVSWSVQLPARGSYRIFMTYAAPKPATEGELSIGELRTKFLPVSTGGWGKYSEQDIGPVLLRKPGSVELSLQLTKPASGWDFQKVRLVKED